MSHCRHQHKNLSVLSFNAQGPRETRPSFLLALLFSSCTLAARRRSFRLELCSHSSLQSSLTTGNFCMAHNPNRKHMRRPLNGLPSSPINSGLTVQLLVSEISCFELMLSSSRAAPLLPSACSGRLTQAVDPHCTSLLQWMHKPCLSLHEFPLQRSACKVHPPAIASHLITCQLQSHKKDQ